MRLDAIASCFGAAHDLDAASGAMEPARMTMDSRAVAPGDLFIALAGERTDGHLYVKEVFEKGACAALVVHKRLPDTPGVLHNRLLYVENTACALQSMAARVLAEWGRPVAGITGSAGKTTIKDLTAGVLSRAGRVLKSEGNLNTAIGLPLVVGRMITGGAAPADFDYAVLEMGMSSFGEIARLAEIARPEVGVVGNVGAAHIEFFGTQDRIARAKAELVDGIRLGGAVVLNADDARVSAMGARRPDLQVIRFGIDAEAEVRARGIGFGDDLGATRFVLETPAGSADVALPLIGRHNVSNALAAAAVGVHFGLAPNVIASALSETAASPMRGEVLKLGGGMTVVDDSYNSNPQALVEAVRTVSEARGFRRRIVVAGEMLELGAQAEQMHRECGAKIAALGVDLLIGVRGLARDLVEGAQASGAITAAQAIFCETTEEAAERVIERAQAGDLVLVKGSRGVRTERVVERLKTVFGSV